MRGGLLLLLLLLLLALGAGAWLVLGDGEAPDEVGWEEDGDAPPLEARGPDEGLPRPIELPPTEHPRVAVYREGEPLPPDPRPGGPAAFERLHELTLGGDGRRLSGRDVVKTVSDVVYLRVRSEKDLRALERLDPEPEWVHDPVPLDIVLDHWRRNGFLVDEAGHVLIITQMDEREE